MLEEEAKRSRQRFLLLFSQLHPEFCMPEFESVCDLMGIKFHPDDEQLEENISENSPLKILAFERGEADVQRLLKRALLIRAAYQIIFEAPSHDQLLAEIVQHPEQFGPFNNSQNSWSLSVASWGNGRKRKRSFEYIKKVIQRYGAVMPLEKSSIRLDAPTNKFFICEQNIHLEFEPSDINGNLRAKEEEEFHKDGKGTDRRVLLCRFGQYQLKNEFAIKERPYIGNSTMDPELAFLQANLAKVAENSLVLDPFCGTGGIILPTAHFGAFVLGAEIQYDVARAVGKSARAGETYITRDASIRANFVQKGLERRFLGVLLADSSKHRMWRCFDNGVDGGRQGLFDAIIADPPYGVRESAQTLGKQRKQQQEQNPPSNETVSENSIEEIKQNGKKEIAAEKTPPVVPSYPSKQRYSFGSVFLDLLDLSDQLLREGGRLNFWFPVNRKTYSAERDLPRHPNLALLYNCEKPLTRDLSRRLLVYEKQQTTGGKISPQQNAEKVEEKRRAYFPDGANSVQNPLHFRDQMFPKACGAPERRRSGKQ